MTRLEVHAMTIDGHPYLCPECAAARFTLTASRPPVPAWPSLGSCVNSCHWEDAVVTNAVLAQIQAARTGRSRAEDVDRFRVVVAGTVLEGVLAPELTVDDVRTAGRIYWRKIARPVLRRGQRRAKRAALAPVRAAGKAGRKAAGAASAAALRADWEAQSGGWDPEPVEDCASCEGAGGFELDTRLHSKTGRGWIRCTVCRGSGTAG